MDRQTRGPSAMARQASRNTNLATHFLKVEVHSSLYSGMEGSMGRNFDLKGVEVLSRL